MKKFISLLAVLCLACTLSALAMAEETPSAGVTIAEAITLSTDTTWDETTTLAANLTVNPGVTLTLNAGVTVSGKVTISGGGTIKRGENFPAVLLNIAANAEVVITNITLDGGYDFSAGAGVVAQAPLVQNEGTLTLESGAVLKNANREDPPMKTLTSPDPSQTAGIQNSGSLFMKENSAIQNMRGYVTAIYNTGTAEFAGTITDTVSSCEELKEWSGCIVTDGSAASLTMRGGEISKNTAYFMAISVRQGSTFTLEEGKIAENTLTNATYGTVVYIRKNKSTGNFRGGSICDNQACAAINAIGDTFASRSSICLQGTEISGNTGYGAATNWAALLVLEEGVVRDNGNFGIYCIGDASLHMKGKIDLQDALSDNRVVKDYGTAFSVSIQTNDANRLLYRVDKTPTTIYLVAEAPIGYNLDKIEFTGVGLRGKKVFQSTDDTKSGIYLSDVVEVAFDYGNGEIIPGTVAKGLESIPAKYGELPGKETGFVVRWYTEQVGGSEITAETQVTEMQPHTLYARWASAVTFDANGGVGVMDRQVIAKGDGETPLAENAFTRDGYAFSGWNTAADGTGTFYADKAKGLGDAGIVTLYAVWKAQTSTVPDTGLTLDKASLPLEPGGTAKLKATLTPAAATYKYIFWTSSDEAVATVSDSGLVTALAEGTATVTAKSWYGNTAACEVTVKQAGTPTPPDEPDQPDPWPTEGLAGFVTRCYRVALGRHPDKAGHADWVRWLQDGTVDATACTSGFVFSKEMNNKNLSDEDFVKTLYRLFMDREGEATGVAFWTEYLQAGHSREEVFHGFADSAEFARIKTNYGIR